MTDSDVIAGLIVAAFFVLVSFLAALVGGIYGHALWLVLRYGWNVLGGG